MNDETTVAGELEKAGGEALTQTETAPEAAEPSGETEKTENTQQSETTEAAKQTKKKNFLTRGFLPSDKNMGYAFTIYTLLAPYFIWGVIALLYYSGVKEKYAWIKWGAIPAGVLAALDLVQVVRVFIRCRGKKKVGEPVNRFVFALIFSFNSMLMPDMIMGSPPVKANILYTLLGLALCMTLYLIGLAIF